MKNVERDIGRARHLQHRFHDSLGQCLSLPGLPGRLNACVQQLNARQPTPVGCTMEGMPLPVSSRACDILPSAGQELLVNACKHLQAKGGHVSLIGARSRWRRNASGGVNAHISRVPRS